MSEDSDFVKKLLAGLPKDDPSLSLFEKLSDRQAAQLIYDWTLWARPNQMSPSGAWTLWLVLAGRGFGKTRTGAEWVRQEIEAGRSSRMAIVAPTAADLRDVIVEGESGILATAPPWNRPLYEPTKRRLTWPNGGIATLFSAEEPERLRGPQHDNAWCDEVAAWPDPQAVMDMLNFGLRLGKNPRKVLTTTPKPIPYIKNLIKDSADPTKGIIITKGSTYDNMDNLAKPFRDALLQYEGTRLGQQEIHAEIVDFNEQGIIKLGWFRRFSVAPSRQSAKMVRLSFDTAFKPNQINDPSVCGVWIENEKGHHLVDVWRDRAVYPDLRRRAKTMIEYWQPHEVLIEDAASGQSLIQDLRAEGSYPIIPINPRGQGDKTIRAARIAPLIESGMVLIPERAPWLLEFETEIENFPLPEFHDDQVDMVTQYLNRIREPSEVFIG
jgi:predicted phage terminase large subunit-like protein